MIATAPTIEDTARERVDLDFALRWYLRKLEEFERASDEFNNACQELRSKLGKNRKFAVKHDCQMYLVTSDGDGNFDVEPIESL